MKLSPHFNLAELTQSQTAARKGIDNTPNSVIINNLTIVAANMETVRTLLNNLPISISSGYRSPALNKAVGGSKTSAHVEGWACDFICPAFGTPAKIVDLLKSSDLKFDQIIEEGTWVHISFAPTMRKQVMKASFKNGKPSYSFI
jgi:zinc D-Ala-D-Ala carboxypeptidase